MNEKASYTVGSQPYQPVPSQQAPPPPHYHWKPSFLRQAPWLAITSLLLAFLCTAASAVIITISDNEIATWRFQPSVILAFLAAVASALLLVTLRYGVTITWWRAVVAPQGTPLANLHRIWNHGGGGGILPALLAGRNVNKIAVATILIAITSIAYSPLLQRASHTRATTRSSNSTLSINMAKDFPIDAGGQISDDGRPAINPSFMSAIQGWYRGDNIATWDEEGYVCNGTCTGYVAATGIMGDDCTQTREPVDILDAAKKNAYIFSINFTQYDNNKGLPTLEMTVKGLTEVNDSCVGIFVTNTCKMHVGTVNFPLVVQKENISFSNTLNRQYMSEPVAYPGDTAAAKPGDSIGPLSALYWFGGTYFLGNVSISINETTGNYGGELMGSSAAQYTDTTWTNNTQPCYQQFTDPTADIIQAFSHVLFRGAFYASQNDTRRSFPVLHTQQTLVYESVYSYLSTATVLVFLAIVAAASTLWGWWELGREISLSPLETGRALGAQVLEPASSPDRADELVEYIGGRKVRYGELYGVDSDGVTTAVLGVRQVGVGYDPMEPRRTVAV